MSARERILLAVIAALNDSEDKPSGVTIARSRRQKVRAEELPLVNVFLIADGVAPIGNKRSGGEDRLLRIVARILHHDPEGNTDALIDPIAEFVVPVVVAALGPEGVEVETEWDGEDHPETYFAFADITFTVRYKGLRGTI